MTTIHPIDMPLPPSPSSPSALLSMAESVVSMESVIERVAQRSIAPTESTSCTLSTHEVTPLGEGFELFEEKIYVHPETGTRYIAPNNSHLFEWICNHHSPELYSGFCCYKEVFVKKLGRVVDLVHMKLHDDQVEFNRNRRCSHNPSMLKREEKQKQLLEFVHRELEDLYRPCGYESFRSCAGDNLRSWLGLSVEDCTKFHTIAFVYRLADDGGHPIEGGVVSRSISSIPRLDRELSLKSLPFYELCFDRDNNDHILARSLSRSGRIAKYIQAVHIERGVSTFSQRTGIDSRIIKITLTYPWSNHLSRFTRASFVGPQNVSVVKAVLGSETPEDVACFSTVSMLYNHLEISFALIGDKDYTFLGKERSLWPDVSNLWSPSQSSG